MERSSTEWHPQPMVQPVPRPADSSQVLEQPRLGWLGRTGAIVGGITGAVC